MTSALDYRLPSLHPRLSDWTATGYRNGAPLPDRPATIPFPAGVTTLTQPLKLQNGDIVKGQGKDVTILRCPSLLVAVGKGKWFAGGATSAPGWSTGGGWISADGALSEIGIEDLTIEFPAHAATKHFYEEGFNGIFLSNLSHSWVRRVRIINPDSGLLCYKLTNVTFEDIEITHPFVTPNAEGHVGHYGVMLGRDCTRVLVSGLRLTHRARHDTDVANGAHHNVVERSTFADYACSQHGGGPHHNLFTDLEAGAGSRFWFSGGAASAMPHNGPAQVVWGVRKADGSPLSSLPPFGSAWRRDLAIVGHTQSRLNTDLTKEWVEAGTPDVPNVYRAQRGEGMPPPPPPPPEEPMFAIGDTVRTTDSVIVRQGPAKSTPQVGTKPLGTLGTLSEGPVKDTVSGYTYWRVVEFGGWVGENKLRQ